MTEQSLRLMRLRLVLIVAGAFVFRLALLPLVHNPGINDPAHYYNLGRRLSEGEGFSINYVWHYARLPVDIVHATDHWMPLTGVVAALGMSVGGVSIHAALALFVLAGSLAPLLAFAFARQLGQSSAGALTAAIFAAVLPELVLNSLRTDTTIVNIVLVGFAVLCLNHALRSGRTLAYVLCGLLFGLAHLTRNDSIILFALLLVHLVVARAIGVLSARRRDLLLLIAAFAATIAPWQVRNLLEIGALGSPQMPRMPFMVEPRDLYAYNIPITLESMFARQSAADLLGKRVFEFGAALKQMAVSLQLPLAVLAPAGLWWCVKERDKRQLLPIVPALLWIVGILIVYPILMPVHNQGGSFKKLFLTIAPLLIPLGALALEQVRRRGLRRVLLLFALVWLAWGSYDLVRRETANADTFYRSMRILVDELETLPDVTGDNEVRVMSQNPYVLSVFGYSSVVTPLASREDTLALAREFEIDYLLMPAARPALDALYLGGESDPRFARAAHLADAGEIPFELYRFVHDA